MSDTEDIRNFEVNGVKYYLKSPNAEESENANMESNRVFSKALNSGALLREKLEQHMRDQDFWSDSKQKEYDKLIASLNKSELKLKKGGIKLNEARKIALDMRQTRNTLQELVADRNRLDVNTAQGQAESARFNYLLVASLVYKDSGKPVYESVSDYLEKQNVEDNLLGYTAAEKFGQVYFGLSSDYEKKLPENQFLQKWHFIDDDLRLVNKEGGLVDSDGNLIDASGRYIDSEGNFVDIDGNLLTADGEYKVEFQPFLDDDGKPIVEEAEEKPKRGRPKAKKQETVAS